jgi:hypothetical protein
MPATGYPSYTNATIAITTGGSYLGDGINGWSGGATYSFTVRERRLTLNRPKEETTDANYASGVGGPVFVHCEFVGYFKTGTIPPSSVTQQFVYVTAAIGQTFSGVLLVTTFEQTGVIGQSLGYRLIGDSDGTFTMS